MKAAKVGMLAALEILGAYNFRRFDKDDWDGYAGAESFSENVRPFITEFEFEKYALIIIVDKNGVEVDYCDQIDDLYDDPKTYMSIGNIHHSLRLLAALRLHKEQSKEQVEFLLGYFMNPAN